MNKGPCKEEIVKQGQNIMSYSVNWRAMYTHWSGEGSDLKETLT